MCSNSSALRSLLVAWRSKASAGLRGRDALAVVHHPHQPPTALAHLDPNLVGARVQAVLDQFFDGRGGAFDNFTRGDAAGDLGGKHSNGHGAL
jgi:hypothetical protein